MIDPRLEPTKTLPKRWIEEDYGVSPPNENALTNATRGLEILDRLGFQPKSIEPDVDNGIEFSWRQGKRTASLSFMNEAGEDPTDIITLISNNEGLISCWCADPTKLEDEIKVIQQFIEDNIYEGPD